MKCLKQNRRKLNLTIPVLFLLINITAVIGNPYAEEQKKTTVSVYGLTSIGISQSLASSLQKHLESNLLRYDEYDVMSRNNIDLILKESRLQQAGVCSEEECLVEAGNILGVEKIITGTISMVGSTYNVVLKIIDVGTAKLESSVSKKHSGNGKPVNTSLIVAVGKSIDFSGVSIPLNLAVSLNNDGTRLSFVFGYAMGSRKQG
jgi:hypothetical protein